MQHRFFRRRFRRSLLGILGGLTLLTRVSPCLALDLSYNPMLDAPREVVSSAKPLSAPPLFIRQPLADTSETGGWHWLSHLSASRPKAWQGRTQAERVANSLNDLHNARRNPLPWANDLPESLQDLPLTVDVGVQYQF